MSKKKKGFYKKKGKVIKQLNQKILRIFNSYPKQIFNYKQIASKLMIHDANGRNQIVKKLVELKAMNRIEEVSPGKYVSVAQDYYYNGIVDMTSRGNAYVICDELDHDIYIPSRNLNKALHQDFVKVYVYNRKRSKKQEGDIVEILERAKSSFVGVLQKQKHFGFVVPDDQKMYTDIFIPEQHMGGAEDGDKVLASLKDWPEKSKNPFGKIEQVLGKPGEHDTEIHSILLEYGLPYQFEESVENFAATLPLDISQKEIDKRRDMRKDLTFTIDPKDAKDFDDALSFKILENGHFEVGIHIADVTHYVNEGTVLDDEAYQRATSVYLVDRVVPMLPEVLSNQVCSLRPEEEKLTFSVVFELDQKAHVINKWFGRTVIYSDKRYTYEQAQEIIEAGRKDNESPLEQAILELDILAKIIRKRRMKKGAISFDKTEVKFNLDQDNNPIGVYVKESKDANKLIEEFMLLANKKVAEFIGRKKDAKHKPYTFVYRIHDEPDVDKLAALQGLIRKFGYQIKTDTREHTTESINQLLADVHGKAESNMIETLAIRSMSKAIYTTENIGHYGLAFDHYTHFTSPIRRYPDVMVHRLLQHYLDGGKSVKTDLYEEKCKHASEREFMAAKAERDSIKYMQVKYMQDHQNEIFKGVISGVTEWGIYVEIIENKCEGMVRIKDIQSDYYIFDESQYALVGQSTKHVYQLGDEVEVSVKHTDLERKHLDFNLVENF